jgi:hypothetical protein
MDPNLIAEQPSGFYAWIMQYGQVVAFVAQMVYWAGMLVLLFYAVWQYKRWVNFQLGTGRSGQLRDADDEALADKPSVDEFVE